MRLPARLGFQAGHIHPLKAGLLSLILGVWLLLAPASPAAAALTTNSYDGNIYSLYAGNGSLVPPRTSLAQAMADHRPVVLIFYLDDSADSKQFAPVVSELQRLWASRVEIIPLTTDQVQNRPDQGTSDPAHYWKGLIPQVVVLDAAGRVVFDGKGQVSSETISAALSKATGLNPAGSSGASATRSFNELNSEVVPAG
ncbi:thylakoid membrane photosystem I accumulation factor [Synechococcus sp. 1G10]|uniref:thylakoid membrane photosystem I accumulation factor n=1 Tax=Synechococcus sp. 1G10 TaxID=2025605 RepID=UPI000B9852E1|nr:thylakoid membrane photosystem I accumulation factor [Synechococcus sp. 1G10]